tara:strand:- start:4778 stop:5827 length:1050 start_codon:yes stop_codon:yes gene_type:complete
MKKVIFLSLIILFSNKTQNVSANQGAFTVDNIIMEGEIRGNNYRGKYIEVAFRKGFQKLIENLIQTKDQKKILSTDLSTIKSLVENFTIIDEKISNDKYSAEVTISFKKNLLNDFFYKRGISYSASKKLETIVYPIFTLNSELQVFSDNKFFQEWNESQEFQNINFILPVENLDDIEFIKKNLDDLEEIDLNQLVDNYEIKNSAILILRYDQKDLSVFLKTNFNNVKKFKKVEFAVKNLENKEVREEIISKLKFSIHDLWKEQSLIDISVPSFLVVNAPTQEPGSLEKVIKKIKQINLITNYSIEELDKDSAKIKIKYLGKIKSLQNSLIENGFNFEILNNEWNLTLAG